jgi:hypothetical protein
MEGLFSTSGDTPTQAAAGEQGDTCVAAEQTMLYEVTLVENGSYVQDQ